MSDQSEFCAFCNEPATTYPPGKLAAGAEDLGEDEVSLCDDCAKDDGLDPDDYRKSQN